MRLSETEVGFVLAAGDGDGHVCSVQRAHTLQINAFLPRLSVVDIAHN